MKWKKIFPVCKKKIKNLTNLTNRKFSYSWLICEKMKCLNSCTQIGMRRFTLKRNVDVNILELTLTSAHKKILALKEKLIITN